ncbi:MAG: hypothetical protein KAR20_14700, partial [Candidatus Heimdallarchaeota archaeon]|nr:hypothetical protein [Candidatus Heimdallarchaeota archaeon]
MNEILSKFAHLKTLAHDEVLKQFNKLETELTVQFLKKFDDLNKKAFQPCEEFDSVEKSEDPEGWWCPEDRCVRTDADDKKVCGAKQNEDKFIQFESVFSRKTTSRIRESFRATIISLIHNVFSKIKSLLHMKSYFTIEYPRIQLIDFDLVTNKRFEFLEPEQKNKLNSSVLITERAIAWLMKWVPVELALGWIALLPKILPKKIKGEINFQRGDHAHLLTYGLVFATWWLARRDCGPPSLPETDSSIAKCPLSALDMVSSAKTVINFFRELPFDKLQTFLSNPIELIPELISSNVLEQPITEILSKTKSNMKRLVTGSALELAGDKLKIPGMTEIADLFMGGDGNSLLSGKVFRTAIDNKFKIMESYSLEERQEYISYDNTILTIKSESEKTRLYYLFGVAPPLEGK